MDELQADEIEEIIAGVLLVIADVGIGDLENEVEVPAKAGPLEALCMGVNEMILALRAARTESEDYQRQLTAKIETIRKQATVIQTLSSPIMEIWDGVLVLPLIGDIDARRAQAIMGDLLERIAVSHAQCVLVDLTGVEVIDTATIDHLLKLTRASSLLGTRCVLTGLSPALAQSFVELTRGELTAPAKRTLREGLADCIRHLRSPTHAD